MHLIRAFLIFQASLFYWHTLHAKSLIENPQLDVQNLNLKEKTSNLKGKIKDDPKPVLPPSYQWPESLVRLGESEHFPNYHFTMDKSNRTLSLWKREENQIQFIDAFPADQGKKRGNKDTLGDLKTPEGIYFFQESYTAPDLDFENYGVGAFTMNYPNFFDRLEKKTGSGIWLHSVPDYKSLYRGSRGCIVVRIDVIKNLKSFITLKKTPIIVQNKIKYLSQNEHTKLQEDITKWFFSWKKAWENKNIEKYTSYYSEQFQSLGKNKKQWQVYKDFLNKKYKFIQVSIKDFAIYKHKNQLIIRFLQNYKSDQFSDYGEKILYLKKYSKHLNRKKSKTSRKIKNKVYKIVGENWFPLNEEKTLTFSSN